MKLFQDATIRLTPSWTDGTKTALVKDVHGLISFRFALWVGGVEVDHQPCVSGQAYNQALLTCGERVSGCGAPIGEGVYALGDSDATNRMNWASGRVGDYSASFKAGLGPLWTGIHSTPEYPCSTGDFGVHADWNADEGMPGTLGCAGLPTPGKSLASLEKYRGWQEKYGPALLVVDHGHGTVLRPPKVGAPPKQALPPAIHFTKLFASPGRLSGLRDGQRVDSLTVRLDFHSGRLGVAINNVQIPPDQVHSLQLVLGTSK